MGVTPLACNQAGKGMMALLGAQAGSGDAKTAIKGVHGDNFNVTKTRNPGLKRRIMT